MGNSIFRKAALEKLSTPEKLDQLIKIVSLQSWVVLMAIGLIIGTSVVWSISSRIKTKLNAAGVLMGGEVNNVVSTASGQLMSLEVALGDTVEKGQVIAIIEQPTLWQRIEESQASLSEKQFELAQLMAFGSEGSRLQAEFIQQKFNSLQQQIEAQERSLQYQKQQLGVEQGLLEQGLITRAQMVATEQGIENTQNQIEVLRAQVAQTNSQQLDLNYDLEKRVTLVQQRISQEQRRLDQLMEQYALTTQIRSLHRGSVVEVLSSAGMVVNQGTSLIKLKNDENPEDQVRGILYVSAQDGKKIKEGMEALVVPATVLPQEFGYMKAKVTYISEFPVSRQGMMVSMDNDQMVQSLLALGAPFEVYVDFVKDTSAFSGYKWTSAEGPDLSIHAGTFCSGKITVKEEPPITMIIPALKQLFDLY
ncbi:NHLP bacteriocin system secretion protein [Pontibacter sp. G13]|uniref:NHLP bacteriocin system secretion protein n=1 Tax=Pontibacter sp. G13 TaxID=3074898 RepID=UPI00288C36B1|nr:NHLP bacteriocin system secretion protein [Pontibacter sp. G13]WNJ16374.1 NHLP bacteriocin system secretion protein [Pontibacter sp. G13]